MYLNVCTCHVQKQTTTYLFIHHIHARFIYIYMCASQRDICISVYIYIIYICVCDMCIYIYCIDWTTWAGPSAWKHPMCLLHIWRGITSPVELHPGLLELSSSSSSIPQKVKLVSPFGQSHYCFTIWTISMFFCMIHDNSSMMIHRTQVFFGQAEVLRTNMCSPPSWFPYIFTKNELLCSLVRALWVVRLL